MSTYQEIHISEFSRLMTDMQFDNVVVDNCAEYVFQRNIHNGPNPNRFMIRIFSSIDRTKTSRDCGKDAIRILLFDTMLRKPVMDWRTNRTKNALTNLKNNARNAWRYVMNQNHHCECGALLVERNGKNGLFLGCSNYPVCKVTRKSEAA